MRPKFQSVICALLLFSGVAAPLFAAERSAAVVYQFKKQTGYIDGRPGYVVDHVIPLCAGGPDTIENLQWQTVAEAKEKDKLERKLCRQQALEKRKPPNGGLPNPLPEGVD